MKRHTRHSFTQPLDANSPLRAGGTCGLAGLATRAHARLDFRAHHSSMFHVLDGLIGTGLIGTDILAHQAIKPGLPSHTTAPIDSGLPHRPFLLQGQAQPFQGAARTDLRTDPTLFMTRAGTIIHDRSQESPEPALAEIRPKIRNRVLNFNVGRSMFVSLSCSFQPAPGQRRNSKFQTRLTALAPRLRTPPRQTPRP